MKTKPSISRWLLSFSLIAAPAWAANITVAPSGGDYTTIQAAVSAANPGDVITVATGTYALSGVVAVNKANLTIQGPPTHDAVITGNISTGSEFFNVSATGVTLQDLTIQKTDKTGVQHLIYVGANNLTVQNCDLSGQYVLGENDVSRAFVSTYGISGLNIVGNNIHGIRQPGYLNGSLASPTTGTITNNTVSGTRGWVIDGALMTFSGNTWSGNAFDIALLSSTPFGAPYDPLSSLIANNNGAKLSDQRVGPNPYSVTNLTTNATFGTIQAAVNAATPGDTLSLEPGTFSEGAVTINKAVTIRGANHGVAVTGSRIDESKITNSKLTVTAAGVVIDGVQIDQTDNTQDAVLLQAPATVTNSIIKRMGVTTGQPCRGITTSVGLAGYSITGNLFTGDSSGSFFSGHKTWNSGMYVNGGTGSITGNIFENCRSAINLDDFNAGIVVSGNTFRTCGTYLSFGGVTPTTGSYTIAGNEFFLDWPNIATNTLPSALLNLSNVDPAFRLNVIGNTFGGVASASLSLSQKYQIEGRMYHRGRSNRNGVVDFVAGEQIEVAGTTIASAIAAAAPGDVVRVGPGTYSEDVALNKSVTLQGDGPATTTIIGPIGGTGGTTVQISASNAVVDGFTLTRAGNNLTDWNDPLLNTAAVAMQGQSFTGVRVSNNVITACRTGIDVNNSNGHTIRNNVITNNRTGLIFRNQTDNLVVTENEITDNWTVGVLFLDASGGTNSPVQTAANCNFTNNNISGNWYGQIVDRQTGGSLPAPGSNPKNFEKNWLGTTSPTVSTANSAEPGYAAQIPVAFGGSATAPGGQPTVLGAASANVDINPFLASGTDTNLETTPGQGTFGFQGDLGNTIEGLFNNMAINSPQSYTDLYIAPGTTVTVTPGGSLAVGDLDMAAGSILEVNGGELDLGDGSVISGTFTIFNSFGSWNINGDTTFNIGQALALVTDIHVAGGKTVTVNGGGELILDGCIIDSQTPGSPYNFTAATDGLLTMARCVVTDANIDINTTLAGNLRSRIYDNGFITSDIEASSVAKVYHNLLDAATAGSANTDATTAFDPVDGWGNVTSASSLQNKFTLDFNAPVDPTRTLDANGNLFVQTADPVVMGMDVSTLGSNAITAAEALLGYNSTMLTPTGAPTKVTPLGEWEVIVETAPAPTGLGIVDSALGLELDAGEEGITTDSTIANVNFTAGVAGKTLGFFRVQTNHQFAPDGSLIKDTRLTKSVAGVPSLLNAFTANTGELIIDNDAPAIAEASVNGTQVQPTNGTVDVLDPSPTPPTTYVIRNGTPVVLTFTATDTGLAGLDAADALNDLELSATNGSTVLSDWTVSATESLGVVTYTVTLNVPAASTTGTYAVTATVIDRSGNLSPVASLGSFQIDNEVLATVELQGYGDGTRAVVFTATDGAGTVLTTWTKSVVFTGAVGTVPLEAVPAGTTAISAKTAWNLRSKKTATFTPEGVAAVSLTGADLLPAGDITGDNVVNTLDYSVLRYHWQTTHDVADLTGDALVTTADYNLLRANFYTVGDAQ